MINSLHRFFHRPEKGWDPVPLEHAEWYAGLEWKNLNVAVIDQLEQWLGGLQGKRVLDLGGGPGQFSVAFAQRGAHVTWHDISRHYQSIVQQHAQQANVELEISLGYFEDAKRFRDRPFDLVFNRICWCYSANDRAFAKLIYALLKPGGAGYIDSNTQQYEQIHGRRRLQYFLNNWLGWKIGHPYPPHGRIARLLHHFPIDYMIMDYTSALNDKVFFVKSKAVPR